jgi:trans-2,3-dihydro-3-hydroxyanthranilate isomerase
VQAFRYVVCDVFTAEPLAGNQLAVFTDARAIPEHQLQRLARELNFSETTFVYPPEADGHVRMRIFTPATEVPFAGHPTLGTAFVLGGPLSAIVLRLETKGGIVPVELEREGPKIVFGRMQQPLFEWETVGEPGPLLAALGVGRSALPVERYALGPGHVFVALPSPAELAALSPDLDALARLTPNGLYCFALDGDGIKARVFLPAIGIPEDPATGSGAGPLAVHLARHGWAGWGELVRITQGVEIGRRSTLYGQAFAENGDLRQVVVGGPAVVVARGEFNLP